MRITSKKQKVFFAWFIVHSMVFLELVGIFINPKTLLGTYRLPLHYLDNNTIALAGCICNQFQFTIRTI